MYTFVFEDSPDSPSSKLLMSCYNGKSIHFTNGNLLARAKINDLLNKGHTNIVLFLDVNPNNKSTVTLYNSLRISRELEERWRNVIIVPIICIEYYIALMCKFYNYFDEMQLQRPTIQHLVGCFEWNRMPNFVKGKSLEKIYKRLFEANDKCQACLINHSNSGLFYLEDCKCNDCTSNGTSLLKKAEQLYTCLPAFEVIDGRHKALLQKFGISSKTIQLSEIQIKQQKFYDNICAQMNTCRFTIDTITAIKKN